MKLLLGKCWVDYSLKPNKAYGYSQVWDGVKMWRGHRLSYTILVGPIPEGYVIDHLCRNRRCYNPAHLEPVTSGGEH